MQTIAARAKKASYQLATLSKKERNDTLKSMAKEILKHSKTILAGNKKDLSNASDLNLAPAMIKRLELNEKKIQGMARGLLEIAKLEDPLNRILEKRLRPNGLKIDKISVPLGVVLIIFESRPNVTADCAGLCVKSGNSVILRGGKEAHFSNLAIYHCLQRALTQHGVEAGAVELVSTRDRSDVDHLLQLTESIDVVIPRGGEGLIRKVAEMSKIPVIKHYKGVCHTYVDKDADLQKAVQIARNAKVQNPGVCNAMETLLVHQAIAKKFLPAFEQAVLNDGLEIRGCAETKKIITRAKKATVHDWQAEYLDLILAVRIVPSLDEAISHIRLYGSGHSDAIVSKNKLALKHFSSSVHSACVFENTSTRFADGGEFGMGAEMGISTDKLHARGPVGLRELTSYKYVIVGSGQIRV